MMLFPRLAISMFAGLLLWAGSARAELIDRGGGLIYDSVLNVTWMQDARYAITSGASAPGSGMSWLEAKDWANSLEYYDPIRNVTWTDWRLPSTNNALASQGFDTSGLSSELAYMYFVNLGFAANESLDRWDPEPTSTNYNPFTNMSYRAFWSGTEAGNIRDRDWVWAVHFHFGWQFLEGLDGQGFAWAVRDGDVAATGTSVPEPAGSILLALGIGGLAVRRRAARSPVRH